MAVIEIIDSKFVLQEYAPGVSIKEIIKATEGEIIVSDNVCEMQID